MREIKFRGKSAGEWHYGHFFAYRNTGGGTGAHFIVLQEKEDENLKTIQVMPETVGQFTGLQDSKGNDIYEGDILCIRQHELDILRGVFRETEINCVVEFRNGAFIPVMSDGNGYCWSNFIYDKMPTADYTVIGNIHDNPEMMEANQ